MREIHMIRVPEGVKSQELLVERPLKTGTQQQRRHCQRRKMLPEAAQVLLLFQKRGTCQEQKELS